MGWFFNLYKRLNKCSKERKLIADFLTYPQTNLSALVMHLNERQQPFNCSFGIYHSDCGLIRVDNDIYGFEVKIGRVNKLLDCCPEAYGLTSEQGKQLFLAILSCVPGSVTFKEKVEKRIQNGEQM